MKYIQEVSGKLSHLRGQTVGQVFFGNFEVGSIFFRLKFFFFKKKGDFFLLFFLFFLCFVNPSIFISVNSKFPIAVLERS